MPCRNQRECGDKQPPQRQLISNEGVVTSTIRLTQHGSPERGAPWAAAEVAAGQAHRMTAQGLRRENEMA